MTKPITRKDFANPCPVCSGVLFNVKSGKCTACVRKARIEAAMAKIAGREQPKEIPFVSRISQQKLRELEFMGHPLAGKVRYENIKSGSL